MPSGNPACGPYILGGAEEVRHLVGDVGVRAVLGDHAEVEPVLVTVGEGDAAVAYAARRNQ